MCSRNSGHVTCRRRRSAGAIVATAAIVCAIAGCSTPAPKTLSLAPSRAAGGNLHATEADAATGAAESGASVPRVFSVEVVPAAGQNAGNVFGSRMIVSGLDERLMEALNATVSKGAHINAALRMADTPAAPGVARVSFAKAYIHSIYETKSAVVVLKLEHAGNTSYFRAQRTGLNWTGGKGEFRKALIRAFDEAVAKLRPELLRLASAQATQTPRAEPAP